MTRFGLKVNPSPPEPRAKPVQAEGRVEQAQTEDGPEPTQVKSRV